MDKVYNYIFTKLIRFYVIMHKKMLAQILHTKIDKLLN